MISTAIKKGTAKAEWIDAAVKSMTTLNKAAAEVINAHQAPPAANEQRQMANEVFAVHAMTDITGFGLIGHAREIALASKSLFVLRKPYSAARRCAGLRSRRQYSRRPESQSRLRRMPGRL